MQSIQMEEDEVIDDYLVEIEILRRCKHRNVVELYAVHWYKRTLWVRLR